MDDTSPEEDAGTEHPEAKERTCPYCAETIKAGATICRFCQRDLATGTLDMAGSPSRIGSRHKLVLVVLGVLILVAVVAVVLYIYLPSYDNGDKKKLSKKHTLTGTISVEQDASSGMYDDDYWSYSDGDECEGHGGYDDMQAGVNVIVKDGSDNVLSTGQTTTGTYTALGTCDFDFTVKDVADKDFYEVNVGRRGGGTYSSQEMTQQDWNLELSLG